MNVLRIHSSKISHQLIDGEVVAIHFETGTYYSMTETAAAVWGMIEQEATTQQIKGAFKALTEEDRASLEKFLSELVKEKLAVPVEASSGALKNGAEPVPQGSLEFSKPELMKYTDMRDLLLADPIHEVEEAGWPNRK